MFQKSKLVEKNRIVFCIIWSILFALLQVCGYELQKYGHINAWALLFAVLLFIPVFVLTYLLLLRLETIKKTQVSDVTGKKQILCFLCVWAVIFVCWLPVFLAYYPCVMSSDFDIQYYQVVNGHSAYTNHHPYLSTLEIEFFYKLRGLLGTVRKSMAALGLWHLFVLSSAFSFLTLTIYKLIGKKWLIILCTVFFIIYPVNPVLGLSTTKDVVFSAAFTYFVSLIATKFAYSKESKAGFSLSDLGIVFFGLIMCSYRHNAVYAIIAAAILVIIVKSKKIKIWTATITVAILLGYLLIQQGIEAYLGVYSVAKTPEMHSVIIQSMGRTYVNNEDYLSLEDKEMIERYIPKDALHDYNPALSDFLKTPVSNETFETQWNDMTKVISDWIKLGIKYPKDYLEAFLDLTRGYWYLYDTSYATVWGADLEHRMGLLYTNNTSGYYTGEEIWHETKFAKLEMIYEKILSRNDFFKWPIVNMLFRLSFYNWILVFSWMYAIYHRKRVSLPVLTFLVLYLCTLLLGPTAYIRYEYPIMLSIPVIIALLYRE